MPSGASIADSLPPGYSNSDYPTIDISTNGNGKQQRPQVQGKEAQTFPGEQPQTIQLQPPQYNQQPQLGGRTLVIPVAEKDWHQPFCGCMNQLNIALVTFCCPVITEFTISMYSRKMMYWVGMLVCGLLCFLMRFIYWGYQSWWYHNSYYYYNSYWYLHQQLIFMVLIVVVILLLFVRQLIFAAQRFKLRTDRHIRGHVLEDLAVALCCPCQQFAMCQMMAELDHDMVLEGQRTVFTRV